MRGDSGAEFDAPSNFPTGGAGGAGGVSGAGGVGGSGNGTGGTGVATDAAVMAPVCVPAGDSCTIDAVCCTKSCDLMTMKCRPSVSSCQSEGTPCQTPTDCCSVSCVNNRCATAVCTADNQTCTSSASCCSGTCTNSVCQPLTTSCKTAGNPCAGANECCSRLCTNGTCALGSSYCIQPDDVCYRSTDCCTGLCEIPVGGKAGTCKTLKTTGSGGCVQDGIACSGCNNCCSRVCAPYGLSGVKICQPASGCRVVNNLCRNDSDCCGAAGSGLPGDGNVQCVLAAGVTPSLGTCANPNGCNPQGNVCGLKTNSCGNAREDCCDCMPPKAQCCKADSLGVPRCYGGSTGACPTGYTGKAPCCISSGQRCAFSAECCDGTPCVPDVGGVLRCLAPTPGGTTCVASGNSCTSTGDCCAGLLCNITPGAPYGRCAVPPMTPAPVPVSPDGGTTGPAPNDGGTDTSPPPPPPPVCAMYGQACSSTVSCCNNIPCGAPGGTGDPCGGQTGCRCYTIVP